MTPSQQQAIAAIRKYVKDCDMRTYTVISSGEAESLEKLTTLLGIVDALVAERNFLEQNETVVWEVLGIPDGSTIHDVFAAITKLKADLAAANARADAERAAVVKWLRKREANFRKEANEATTGGWRLKCDSVSIACGEVANGIERGEHRKETGA